jgi:hypothetical protein
VLKDLVSEDPKKNAGQDGFGGSFFVGAGWQHVSGVGLDEVSWLMMAGKKEQREQQP